VKCTLCGHEFDEKAGEPACARCPMSHGCNLVRCPNCGFEMPAEPRWVRWLKEKWKGRKHEDQRPG
jgi:rubredoxin